MVPDLEDPPLGVPGKDASQECYDAFTFCHTPTQSKSQNTWFDPYRLNPGLRSQYAYQRINRKKTG